MVKTRRNGRSGSWGPCLRIFVYESMFGDIRLWVGPRIEHFLSTCDLPMSPCPLPPPHLGDGPGCSGEKERKQKNRDRELLLFIPPRGARAPAPSNAALFLLLVDLTVVNSLRPSYTGLRLQSAALLLPCTCDVNLSCPVHSMSMYLALNLRCVVAVRRDCDC